MSIALDKETEEWAKRAKEQFDKAHEIIKPNGPVFTQPKESWQKDCDIIDHPKHYTEGIECWDYIVSHNMDYLQGNIIKYVTRYKHKNGLEDLKKARAYLEKCIKLEEEKNS